MSCHRVKTDGKAAVGEPSTFAQTEVHGMWAPRAFHQSWDGKSVVSHTFDGIRVTTGTTTNEYKIQLFHRNVWWSPDNKHFLLWLPSGIALGDAGDLGPPGNAPKTSMIYRPAKDRFPFGIAWSPSGSSIFVSEHVDDGKTTGTAIKKIPLSGGAGQDILVHKSEITFYMLPDAWYEDGSGPKTKKASIVFGAKDGLFVVDEDGVGETKICDFSPDGVGDVIWDPSGANRFLVMFRQPVPLPGPGNKSIKGLYLIHSDKKGEQALEKISESTDLHTIYFSRKGKYICWASADSMFLRETAKQENPAKIVISDASGAIKGFNWDDNDSKIAIAVENKLFIYDVASKASTLVAKVDEKSFIAEPHWKKDEIVYSTFTNISQKKKLDEPKKETPKK